MNLRESLSNEWPVNFGSTKVTKGKERLRNSSRFKETERLDNSTHCTFLDSSLLL